MDEIQEAYVLTVDWCNKGKRGIFCDSKGNAFLSKTEHTEDEIWGILDCFNLILSPKSMLMTKDEIGEYKLWSPLAEYSGQYGIAVKKEPDRDEFAKKLTGDLLAEAKRFQKLAED